MIQEMTVASKNPPRACAVHSLPARAAKQSLATSSDRDLLMQLLSRCLPLVDAATATTALLDCYDSYAEVVAAPFNELKTIPRLGEHGAHLLKCVHTAAIHLAAAPFQKVTKVSDWPSLCAYLNTSMARERNEVVRVLFLNAKNHGISVQVLSQGTTSSVNVSIREIAEKSLQVGATAILLLHNHPSGDPMPSVEDLDMTQKIEKALIPLAIRLHDHVIVGKGRFYSLKKMKFLPRHDDDAVQPVAA